MKKLHMIRYKSLTTISLCGLPNPKLSWDPNPIWRLGLNIHYTQSGGKLGINDFHICKNCLKIAKRG